MKKNYLKNYKKNFYKLKKAFEEYRGKTDECIEATQYMLFEEEKKVKFWKNICAILLVLLAAVLLFVLLK